MKKLLAILVIGLTLAACSRNEGTSSTAASAPEASAPAEVSTPATAPASAPVASEAAASAPVDASATK
ncbi:MAG: hypothetical protein ACK5Z5_04950 [Neisseriaceae bacterium]